MLWHLRPISAREEHQFFNLVELFRWFRDWSRTVPELATPELAELDQLMDTPGAELGAFIRAEQASESLVKLRDRVLRIGLSALRASRELNCGSEQILVSSYLSGETAFVSRYKKPGRGAREGLYSTLLEDSILRLDYRNPALLVLRETPLLLEAELRQWSAVVRIEPAFEAPLAQWISGYLAKFRPCHLRLNAEQRTLRIQIEEMSNFSIGPRAR